MEANFPPVNAFVEVLPATPQQERRRGILRFCGLTDFADGIWAGVELVGSEGHHDGTVKGVRYFQCPPYRGAFVRPSLVVPYAPTSPAALAAVSAVEAAEAAAQDARREAEALRSAHDNTQQALQHTRGELEQSLKTAAELEAALSLERTRHEAAVAAVAARTDVQTDVCAREEEEEEAARGLTAAAELERCSAELKATSASLAAAEHLAREASQKAEREAAARADLNARATALQVELTSVRAELAAAATTARRSAVNAEQPAVAGPGVDVELCQLRANLAAATRRVVQLEEAQTRAEVKARDAEERCRTMQASHEREVADVREAAASEEVKHAATCEAVLQPSHDAEALASALRTASELQDLCQLLEDELAAQKAQSDALARVVEELGAAKTAAEVAAEDTRLHAAQERDRLLREVEEARAREVQALDASTPQREEAGRKIVAAAAAAAANALEWTPPATAAAPVDAATFQRCRDELDEANARLVQLAGTQYVADELQSRCDALAQEMRDQRAEATAQAVRDAAERQETAQEAARWRRACEAAQQESVGLAAQLRRLEGLQSAADAAAAAAAVPNASLSSPFRKAREAQYEARIGSLTRQLLETQATHMSCSLWDVALSSRRRGEGAMTVAPSLSEPISCVLDFTTPEACRASAQALFEAHGVAAQ